MRYIEIFLVLPMCLYEISMKKFIRFLMLALPLLSLIPASAVADVTTGKVTVVLSMVSGAFFFHTVVAADRPACSNGDYAIPLTGTDGPGGKVAVATIMQAIALGKEVTVVGKGVCDVWGDRETVLYVVMNN